MKCPHCAVEFYNSRSSFYIGEDVEGTWYLLRNKCPGCNKLILHIYRKNTEEGDFNFIKSDDPKLRIGQPVSLGDAAEENAILVRPKGSSRPPCPPQVPNNIAEDYIEACLTLADSPKASAALSRRCLQNILRDPEAANAQQNDLVRQIEYILNSGTLPSYIASNIDAIRNIGNFAAHPTKSHESGGILSVEPGEAEWNLNVIEDLFDFYYVQPALSKIRRDTLNTKLQAARKPPMR